PFNLENLQTESYQLFRNSPSQTLRMAETLYLGAMISYPRTSSEKLPSTLDFVDIITSIGRSSKYSELTKELLKNRPLKPRGGRGEDPAHPAIYPTGSKPETLLGFKEAKLLDLVTRRFLSSFAPPAAIENTLVILDLNKGIFHLTGRRILNQGWMKFYSPYVKTEETIIPSFKEGQKVVFKEVTHIETLTAPPPRYNVGSLLRKMDEYGLGTKATRAGIIDTLGYRRYVSGECFKATELGLAVHDTLSKFCPVLVSADFTRRLENKMEAIRTGETNKKEVVSEAVASLSSIMTDLNKNEYAIGESLSVALRASNSRMRTIGSCPICKKGHLQIIRSRRTGKIFAGCSNYEEGSCRAAFPLPQPPYRIWTTRRLCKACSWPTVTVRSPRGGRPWSLCLNPDCITKEGRKKHQSPEMPSSQSASVKTSAERARYRMRLDSAQENATTKSSMKRIGNWRV
ncbi:DNA topoisomerase, partial [Candidatus Bathyarchaeota archaeon]|nr:DNA topoisomerase [Candidatus Bathyarchaeota archaeon]